MPTVGFLHTSPVHVATFDALVAELAPAWAPVHHVDAALLDGARADGVASVEDGLDRALQHLADRRVDLIVCTCSTIGGLAERRSDDVVRTVRVDRPMAELAVESGRRIAVVAALESTVVPTTELLSDVAEQIGVVRDVEGVVVGGAWERFEAGDLSAYHRSLADRLPAVAERSDVIVLAQASMAGAAALVGTLDVPVLASPRVAVVRLLGA